MVYTSFRLLFVYYEYVKKVYTIIYTTYYIICTYYVRTKKRPPNITAERSIFS